jgi:hypothetical protein
LSKPVFNRVVTPCIGVNTEIRAKIVFWLKLLLTSDDNIKEPAYVSQRDYAAVKLELIQKRKKPQHKAIAPRELRAKNFFYLSKIVLQP